MNKPYIQLIKTINEWKKENEENYCEAKSAAQWGHANYLSGKDQAYFEVLQLLIEIQANKTPFKL